MSTSGVPARSAPGRAEPQKPEPIAHVGSDSWRVLADACREDQGVEPAQCCCHGRHCSRYPVRVHAECELRRFVIRRRCLERSEIPSSDRPSRPDSSFRARSTSSTDSPCSRWTRGGRPDRSSRIESPSGRLRAAKSPSSYRPSVRRSRPSPRLPPPRWHTTRRRSPLQRPEAQTPARRTTARTARGSRSAGFPTLRATSAVARRSRPRVESSRGTRCRRPRHAARWERARAPRRCPRAPARCEGERRVRLADRLADSIVDQGGLD